MITWETVAASIAILAACSGLGVLITFHLGPLEQTRIKDRLKQIRCRLRQLDWSNFEPKEAQLCVDLIDRWLGRRVWHWRRFAVGLALIFLFGWVAVLVLLAHAIPVSSALFELMQPRWIAWYVLPLVIFSFSVSLTRALSRCVVLLAPSRIFGNLLLFAALSVAHYALLIYWQPFAEFMVGYFGTGAVDSFFGGTSALRPWSLDFYGHAWAAFWRIYGPGLMTNSIWPDGVMRREIYIFDLWNSDPEYAKAYVALTSAHALGWIANFLRLAIALSLFATLVLRTMLARPVMGWWMRMRFPPAQPGL